MTTPNQSLGQIAVKQIDDRFKLYYHYDKSGMEAIAKIIDDLRDERIAKLKSKIARLENCLLDHAGAEQEQDKRIETLTQLNREAVDAANLAQKLFEQKQAEWNDLYAKKKEQSARIETLEREKAEALAESNSWKESESVCTRMYDEQHAELLTLRASRDELEKDKARLDRVDQVVISMERYHGEWHIERIGTNEHFHASTIRLTLDSAMKDQPKP